MVPRAHVDWAGAMDPFLEAGCSWRSGLWNSFRLQESLLGGSFRRFGLGQQ